MLVYLDTSICVYVVDGEPSFKARATTRLASIRAAGDTLAISDLSWLECRMKPIRTGDRSSLSDMEAFLTASDITRISMPFAVFERACEIRAFHNFKLADSLHLAVAIEGDCDIFLTNDQQLSRFLGIKVEMLP